MYPRLLAVVAAGALTLSLLGATGARADDPDPTPQLPDVTVAEASAVLDEAQAVFEEKSRAEAREAVRDDVDATLALNQLMRVYEQLSPAERRSADRLLARPTDEGGDTVANGTFEYEDGEEAPVCGEVICVHYATSEDEDAPPDVDTDSNGIPDAVDQSFATAEAVHEVYADADYLRPEGDGLLGGGPGPDLVDIYLADTGSVGLYGYCTADDLSGDPPYHRPAYCVIDDDFEAIQFPSNTPLENQQVTLAHEYFHAVQYAYDAFEDLWISEATATWVEDELFPDVNDNLQYLPRGQLERPGVPLDQFSGISDTNHYGNWIFFRYLTERWDAETGSLPTIVLDLWERLDSRTGEPDDYSTEALQNVLADRGTSFTTVYGQFADANRRPEQAYDEGELYPVRAPHATRTLTRARRGSGPMSATLDHLTHATYRFTPANELRRRDWSLRLSVDMPVTRAAPVARVSIYREGGGVTLRTIRLRSNGTGSQKVDFSSREVRYVELVLVNASRRSSCWFQDITYACQGRPRDNNLRTTFRGTAFID